MEYIINPMWFYWLQVANGINMVSVILVGVSGLGEVALLIACVYNHAQAEEYEDNKRYWLVLRKWAIVCGIIAACLSLIALLVPSKDTCISMMIAKFATYDNAQAILDTVKEATDYVLNAIAGMTVA